MEASSRYLVNEDNPRVASKSEVDGWATLVGTAPLQAGQTTSWKVKILSSKENNGKHMYVGVAPSDINASEEGSHKKYGWYFHCYHSKLKSGPTPAQFQGEGVRPEEEGAF